MSTWQAIQLWWRNYHKSFITGLALGLVQIAFYAFALNLVEDIIAAKVVAAIKGSKMTLDWIMAVDPGSTGSYSELKTSFTSWNKAELESIRSIAHTSKWVHDLYTKVWLHEPSRVLIERVSSRPGQGVKSMFTFGENLGLAKAAVLCAGVDPELIEVKRWQLDLALPKHIEIHDEAKRRKQRREDQKQFALKLFPEIADQKGDVYASVLIAYSQIKGHLLYHEVMG